MLPQVLKEMQQAIVDPAPGPIPLSQQYLKAFQGDDDDISQDAEAPKAPKARKARKARKGPKKVQRPSNKKRKAGKWSPAPKQTKSFSSEGVKAQPATCTGEAVESSKDAAEIVKPAGVAYCPHHFAEKFRIFCQARLAEKVSYRDAAKMWRESSERASYLAQVPLRELKRRRFVKKEVQHNPFAAALAGA